MQRGGGGLKKIEGSKQFRNVPMEFGPEGRVIQNVWLQGSFNGSVSRVCFKVCFKGLLYHTLFLLFTLYGISKYNNLCLFSGNLKGLRHCFRGHEFGNITK